MRNFRLGFVCLLTTLLVAFVAGCGQETVTIPSVVSVTPAQGTIVNATTLSIVTAQFNMAMNSATITAAGTFTLTGPSGPGGPVQGNVTYSGMTATYTISPTTPLASGATYTATITTAAATPGGAALLGNYVWTFSTFAVTPPSTPYVSGVTPTQGLANVPLTGQYATISANFSIPMNPTSINGTTTFTVYAPNGVQVPGSAALSTSGSNSGLLATFTPTSGTLAYGTTYTATISTAAMGADGVAMAGPYVWSFTTVGASVPFVVISSVTPAPFAPNVSLTGAGAAITATFNEAMTAASIAAAGTFTVEAQGGVAVPGSAALNGAGTLATFTPTSGTLAYSTTYTATITTAATAADGAAMAGNYVWTFTTLAPGIPYVSGVAPAQGTANVPLTGANATISASFSIPMSPTSVNGTTTFTVYAPNGVSVPGSALLNGAGTLATFTPTSGTLAYSTTYTATITTAATSVGGYPIVANYVWTFTTIAQGIPAVVPPPTPAPFAPNVSLTGPGAIISVTFNQAMTAASIAAAGTFTVEAQGGVAVPGSAVLNGAGTVATFTPTSGTLAYSTTYTATISTAATGADGAALAGNYVWTFTTLAPGIPYVSGVTPTQGHANVPITGAGATISASFSIPMSTSVNGTTTFTVYAPNGVQVPGSAALNAAGTLATFTPTTPPLANNTTYTATITTAATSVGGYPIVANYVWSFTTITAAPTVIATDPVTPSTVAPIITEDESVPLNQVITANFSEAMAQATIDTTNFALTPTAGGAAVFGSVTYIPGTYQLVFVPGGVVPVNLLPDTEYTATITGGANGVTDLAGTALQVTAPMVTNYTWNFHTVTGASTTAPELVGEVPAPGASDVSLNQAVSATFNEGMNTQTLFGTPTSTADFLVSPGTAIPTSATAIAGTYSYDKTSFIATFKPTLPFAGPSGTSYTATVAGATDLFGNVLGTTGLPGPPANTWTFTIGTAAVPPPVVLGPTITPFGGFSGIAGMTNTGVTTVINGDSGTTATAATSYTGFHDNTVLPVDSSAGSVTGCTYEETLANIGLVTREIYTCTPPPTIGCPLEGTLVTCSIATEALKEAQTAYTTLQGLPPSSQQITAFGASGPGELGGITLPPGVYKSAPGSYEIVGGNLTLDAKGDPSAYWVFQMASTLTVGGPGAAFPESVILINGAQASNVYWAVGSSVTYLNQGGGGTFNGTIIASSAIAVSNAGNTTITTINGRLISLTASTTLVDTVINVPPPALVP